MMSCFSAQVGLEGEAVEAWKGAMHLFCRASGLSLREPYSHWSSELEVLACIWVGCSRQVPLLLSWVMPRLAEGAVLEPSSWPCVCRASQAGHWDP